MPDAPPTAYDEAPYPAQVHAQTHPERLAMIAALAGHEAASPGRCRVLDLGCGDGTNLLAMAQHAPGSEFVGVDLAATAIESGRDLVKSLGWRNVTLLHGDITALPADLGTFDYVVSHGVYSWVPEPVRDALLAAMRAHLRPHGVGFVSYIVYPGAHLSQMLREMMFLHLRGVADPRERVTSALEFLRFLAGTKQEDDPWRRTVAAEVERTSQRRGDVLRHDELGEVRHPVWWHEFAAHAARQGLEFVGEADWFESLDTVLGPESQKMLGALAPDRAAREQYLDFAKCRRFRQSLLRLPGPPLVSPDPRRVVRTLHVASNVRRAGEASLARSAEEAFTLWSGGTIRTDSPVVRATLVLLGDSWPGRRSFPDLLARARDLISSAGGRLRSEGDDADTLSDALFRMFSSGAVRLFAHDAPCTVVAGDRPRSGTLARALARSRDTVVSLVQENVALSDDIARGLVLLLDGTRDRAALLADLADLRSRCDPSSITLPPVDAEHLEGAISSLAGIGLLEA